MARNNYDAAFFEAALRGFEQQKAMIEQKMAELRQELARIRPGRTSRPGQPAAARGKRVLSADARRRIAEAQRRRWARVRREKSKTGAAAKA